MEVHLHLLQLPIKNVLVSSLDNSSQRSKELKFILMIGLCHLIAQRGQDKIDSHQAQSTLLRTGMKYEPNHTIHKFCISPVPPPIVRIKAALNLFTQLRKDCQKAIHRIYATNDIRRLLTASIEITKEPQEAVICAKPMKKLTTLRMRTQKKQNLFQKAERVLQMKPRKHRRFLSQLSAESLEKKAQCRQKAIKKRDEQFLSRKKQQIRFFSKNCIDYSSGKSVGKGLIETIKVFFSNLSSANYLLNNWSSKGGCNQDILVYIQELSCTFQKIIPFLKQMEDIMDNNCQLEFNFPENSDPVVKYLYLSQQIIQRIKNLVFCPKFEPNLHLVQKQAIELIRLLFTSRYFLRYLEKEMENKDFCKRQERPIDRWKEAYRIKFVGRTAR